MGCTTLLILLVWISLGCSGIFDLESVISFEILYRFFVARCRLFTWHRGTKRLY